MKKSISYTAAFIAVKFYGLTLNPKLGQHFDPSVLEYYDRVVRTLPRPLNWYHKSLRPSFLRSCFVASEELLLPGDLMHIVCRKYYIQQWVNDALEQGYEQIIILGSGMDRLGYHAAQKGAQAFEIDSPDMMEYKAHFLSKQGYTHEKLHLCPLDVRHKDLKEVLRDQSAFDPSKKTIVVAEGFFDYLSLSDTRSLLQQLKTMLPDLRLISTFFSLDELNFFYRLSFTSGVAMVGEALHLPLNYKSWLELLRELGYQLQKDLSSEQMREELIQPSGFDHSVLKGFYISEIHSKRDSGRI